MTLTRRGCGPSRKAECKGKPGLSYYEEGSNECVELLKCEDEGV